MKPYAPFGLAAVFAVAVCGSTPAAAGAEAGRGPVTDLPLPRFVSMRAETANARRGPSLDQRVDWSFVRRGLPLEVIAEYGQWRRVRDADGYGGWVHQTLLSGARTALVRAPAPVALRAAPEDGAKVRAVAEPGVVGRVEACRGAWCAIGVGGVYGWLPRTALWGVAPEEQIE